MTARCPIGGLSGGVRLLLSILTMSHPLSASPSPGGQEGESVTPLTSSFLTHGKHHHKNVGEFYCSQMLYKFTGTQFRTTASIWVLLPRVGRIWPTIFYGKETIRKLSPLHKQC